MEGAALDPWGASRPPTRLLSLGAQRRSCPADSGISFYGPRGIMVHGTLHPPRVPGLLDQSHDTPSPPPTDSDLLASRVNFLYQQNNQVQNQLNYMATALGAIAGGVGVALPAAGQPPNAAAEQARAQHVQPPTNAAVVVPSPWTPAPWGPGQQAAKQQAAGTAVLAESSLTSTSGTPTMPRLGEASPLPVPGQENWTDRSFVALEEEEPQKVTEPGVHFCPAIVPNLTWSICPFFVILYLSDAGFEASQ